MKFRALLTFVIVTSTALTPIVPRVAFAEGYFNQGQLRKILAPFALNPDDVLATVMMATTHPDDLRDARDWANAHPDLVKKGGDALDQAVRSYAWDRSVKALITMPDVLNAMSDNLNTTTQTIAGVVETQPGEMMDAIQELRYRAYRIGLIATDKNVTVASAHDIITITPNSRTAMYVAAYNVNGIFGPYPDSENVYTPPPQTPGVVFRGPFPSSPYWTQTFWVWSTHQIISGNIPWPVNASPPQREPVTASLPATPAPVTSEQTVYVPYVPDYDESYRDYLRLYGRDDFRRDYRDYRDRHPPAREEPRPQPKPPVTPSRPPVENRVPPPAPIPATTHVNPDSTPSLKYGLHGGGVQPTPTLPPPTSTAEKERLVEYKSPPLLAPPETPTPRREERREEPKPVIVHNDPPPVPVRTLPRMEERPSPPPAPVVVHNEPPPKREEPKPAPPPAAAPQAAAEQHINPDSSPALKCGLRGCGTPK